MIRYASIKVSAALKVKDGQQVPLFLGSLKDELTHGFPLIVKTSGP